MAHPERYDIGATERQTMDQLPVRSTLILLLQVGQYLVLAHIIMSWLVNFQVLNLRQPLVYQVWNGLNRALEPVYARMRRFVPVTGGLDFAPFIMLLMLIILGYFVGAYVRF